MVDDHTKAGNELKALADAKGVKVPDEPSMAQKASITVLASQEGAKFDKNYSESIGVKAHEDTVKLFKKAAADAKDADIKAFATKTLPTLEHHLQMAKELKTGTDPKTAKAQ
jgi:putative membrane protein